MSLLRQSGQFIIIGLLQLLLDWLVFVLITTLGVPVAAGNVLGRICGAGLGFWLNGRFTFAQTGRDRPGWRHAWRFTVLWLLLTLLSTLLIDRVALALGLHYAWLAKPVVEGLLSLLSFFALRHLVFR